MIIQPTSTYALFLTAFYFFGPVLCRGMCDVSISEITTSSITLMCAGNGSLGVVTCKNTVFNKTISVTTDQRQTTIDKLHGTTFEINVESGLTEKKTFMITLAKCPNGWKGRRFSCYMNETSVRSWTDASQFCGKYPSAHLADPVSWDEYRFMLKILPENQWAFWIGVNDIGLEGNLTYSDKTPVRWSSDLPAFNGGVSDNRDCVAIYRSDADKQEMWTSADCSIPKPFICQYHVPDSVKNLTVLTDNRNATATWSTPDSQRGSTFDLYELSLQSSKESGPLRSLSLPLGENSATFANLSPGHLYWLSTRVLEASTEAYGGIYPAKAFVTNPLPPLNVKLVWIRPTEVMLNWAPPSDEEGDNIFTEYLVTFATTDDSTHLNEFVYSGSVEIPKNETAVTLTNLEPYRTYTAKVVSRSTHVTEIGEVMAESEEVGPTDFKTLISPVEGITVETDTLTSTSFEMKWKPALGLVDGYNITLHPNSGGKDIQQSVGANYSSLFSPPSLTAGETYQVSIETLRSGDVSNKVSILQTTRPTPVSATNIIIQPSTSDTVDVTIINQASSSSILDGYNLTFTNEENSDIKRWRIVHNSTGTSRGRVKSLVPGRNYNVTVYTTSANVLSKAVKLTSIINLSPHPPTGFRLLSRSETEIDLTWDHAPGDFEKYILECKSDEGSCPVAYQALSKSVQAHKFSGLKPGALYSFKFYITKTTRNTNPVELRERTKPKSPRNVRITKVTNSSLQVTWNPPSDIYSDYLVECLPVDETDVLVAGAPPGKKSIEIPAGNKSGSRNVTSDLLGLTPGVLYRLYVMTLSDRVKSKAVELFEPTKPNPIEELRVSSVGETWAALSWLPGNGGLLSFTITWSPVGPMMEEKVFHFEYNVTELIPSSVFGVTVSKQTAFPEDINTTIYVQTRPLPPTNMVLSDISERSFYAMWSPPKSEYDHYVVSLMRVRITKRVKREVQEVVKEQNVTSSNISFGDLIPGASYQLQVEAVYNRTKSYSVQQDVTLYPEVPIFLNETYVTEDEIDIEWTAPEGSIGGFRVERQPPEGKLHIIDDSSAALGGLTPGRTYTIDVFTLSENKNVSSRRSAQLLVTTVETLPGRPLSFELTSNEPSQIIAKWNEPSDPNGRILHYQLLYKQVYPHPTVDFTSIIVDTTNRLVTGVENGAVYYFKVAAVNSAGKGAATNFERVKVKEAVPGPVHELTGRAITSSSISVKWRYPRLPNGDVTMYRLSVSLSDQQLFLEVTFKVKPNANPYKCIMDNAPQEAITSLLSLHVAPSADHSPPPPVEGFEIASVLIADQTPAKDDVKKDLEKLTEAFQSSSNDVTLQPDVTSGVDVTTNFKISKQTSETESSVSYDHDMHTRPDSSDTGISTELTPTRNRRSSVAAEKRDAMFEPLCPVAYTVNNLHPYTLYKIQVRVWNSAGEGEMAETEVRTDQAPPDDSPDNIHVSRPGSRSLTTAWDEPANPNGVPFYTLNLYEKENEPHETFVTNDTRITLNDLEPFTTYALSVKASTEAGEGPSSPFVIVTTEEDVPGVVSNLTATALGSKSVVINWMSPAHPHGVIGRYSVRLQDVTANNSKDYMEYVVNPVLPIVRNLPDESVFSEIDYSRLGTLLQSYKSEPLQKVVTNLRPFTIYEVLVSAHTHAGEGASVLTTVETEQDKPATEPTGLRYTNLTSTSVNISWTEPEIPNGIITYYTVYISSGQIFTRTAEDKFAVVEDLEKYKQYTVYVTANTHVGEGPSSFSIAMLTDEDVPDSPPWNITCENVTTSVVQLFWQPPKIPNGIIRSYTVYYKNETGLFIETSNTTSAYLGWLRPYGEYEITISSNTSKGEGAVRSEPLHIRTMEGQPATPPYGLSYVNVSSRSVHVTWSKPLVPNGIIQYYDVTIAPMDQDVMQNKSLRTKDMEPVILIEKLAPFSKYFVSVRANTRLGDGGQDSVLLLVYTLEDVPETSPGFLKYKNLTSSSIEIKWNPPTVPNGIITSYSVRYECLNNEPSSGARVGETTVPGNTTVLTVKNLSKYSPYLFNISASTVAGEGPSLAITVHTDEDEPSTPPHGIKYEQLSSTAILLHWQPPERPNGPILGYRVYYKLSLPDGTDDSKEYVVESVDPLVVLTNLEMYSMYDVYVTCYTRLGDGDQKSVPATFETLEDAPSDPPRNVIATAASSTSVNITWQPPQSPNGLIQFYTIYYNTDSSDNETIQVEPSPQTTLLSGLEKYTWYEIWLSASTALGDGNQTSETVRVQTMEDVPSQPDDLNCHVINHEEVKITWQAPNASNGIVKSYRVRVTTLEVPGAQRNDKNTSWEHMLDVEDRSYLAQDRRPYALYAFEVEASTAVGFGEPATCTLRTDESVPSMPVNVTAARVYPTSVDLSWQQPVSPNGIILAYNVSLNIVGEQNHHFISVNVSALAFTVQHTLYDLKKYSSYAVKVAAVTSKGAGPNAGTVFFTTQSGVPDFPVETLTITPASSTSLSVAWTPHKPLTGVTIFKVLTREAGESKVVDQQDEVTSERTFIKNLQPYTAYDVTVIPRVVGVDLDGPSAIRRATTLQDIPGSPVSDLRYQERSSTSVYLLWDPPLRANGVITRYTIFVIELDKHVNVSGEETSFVVKNLAKFTNYSLTVTSETHVGAGPSAQIFVKTMQDIPSGPPTNVKVQARARDAVVSWDPPLRPNGIITNYTLRYYIDESDDENFAVIRTTTANLTLLKPFSNYTVLIFSSTEAGMGPSAVATFHTNQDVPTSPTSLTCVANNEHDVSVTWNKPEQENGVIVQYEVTHRISGNAHPTIPVIVSNDQLKYDIKMLIPYTEYQIEVWASTVAGAGESSHCTVRTEEGYPLAPERLYVRSTDETSIEFGWKGPLLLNGELENFMLTYSPPDSCRGNGGDIVMSNDILTDADVTEMQACSIKIETKQSVYLVKGLEKYTTYHATIAASTGKGTGPNALPPITQRTRAGEPDHPPRRVDAVALSSTSINVTWLEPAVLAGETEYVVRFVHQESTEISESPRLEATAREYEMRGLHEHSTYDVTVAAVTSKGEIKSQPVSVTTTEDVPSDFPDDINVALEVGNSTAAKVLFKPPRDPNGKIVQYDIQYRLKDSQEFSELSIDAENLLQPTTSEQPYSWPVVGLLGGRAYTFRVRSSTKVGPGPWSLWTEPVVLPISAAPVPPLIPALVTDEDPKTGKRAPLVSAATITVKNPCVFSDAHGPLASLSVIVCEDGADVEKEPSDWYEAHNLQPVPPYKVIVTTDVYEYCGSDQLDETFVDAGRRKRSVAESKNFVVGSDDTCGVSRKPYCNGPLKSNTPYRFKYRAETTNGAVSDTAYSDVVRTAPSFVEAHLMLIIGTAVAVVVFLLILVVTVILLRRRLNRNRTGKPESDDLSPTEMSNRRKSGPIAEQFGECKSPISESGPHTNMAFTMESPHAGNMREIAVSRPVEKLGFAEHVTRMSVNKNKGFSCEFDDIRGLPVAGTTSAADKSYNRTKNRHARLVPFDHCRVKLQPIPAIDGSDYINASFVPGPQSAEHFIAAQCPLEHTRKDFWRMVWETGATTIVMLCSSAEEGKKKSIDYWPRKQIEYYGNLAVQLIQEDVQLEWTIRQFSITMRDKLRQITQFQLMTWPVHEQSDSAQSVLRFVQTVRANRTPESVPIIVMCSSGSSRSGVFITLDRICETLASSSKVDVFGSVAALRRYRPYMVQTMDEYILIHRCIWEAIQQLASERKPTSRQPTGDGMEETVF